jgi:hypothetical protein
MVIPDIQCSNGVVHIIDKVLLPNYFLLVLRNKCFLFISITVTKIVCSCFCFKIFNLNKTRRTYLKQYQNETIIN